MSSSYEKSNRVAASAPRDHGRLMWLRFFVVVAFQLTTLSILGQPWVRIGVVAIAAGALGGWVRRIRRIHPRSINLHEVGPTVPSDRETCCGNNEVPITLFVPADILQEIDACLDRTTSLSLAKARGHWIKKALEEKLAR